MPEFSEPGVHFFLKNEQTPKKCHQSGRSLARVNTVHFRRDENWVSNAFKLNLKDAVLRKLIHFPKAYFTGYLMVAMD